MATRSTTPGYVVVYPNREKSASKVTKSVLVGIFIASGVLILLIAFAGWSKLQGMKPVDVAWALVYFILAYYVGKRWSRGACAMGAGLSMLTIMVAVIAAGGLAGTSWFARDAFGYAPPKSIFGVNIFGAGVLGFLTDLLIPIQALVMGFCMLGFTQSWNMETEAPIDEARERGYDVPEEDSSADAAAA